MLSSVFKKITQYCVCLDRRSLREIPIHGGSQLRLRGCKICRLLSQKGIGLWVAACVSDASALAKRRNGETGASWHSHDFTDVASQEAGDSPRGRELHPFLPHVLHDVGGDRSVEARTAQRLVESM